LPQFYDEKEGSETVCGEKEDLQITITETSASLLRLSYISFVIINTGSTFIRLQSVNMYRISPYPPDDLLNGPHLMWSLIPSSIVTLSLGAAFFGARNLDISTPLGRSFARIFLAHNLFALATELLAYLLRSFSQRIYLAFQVIWVSSAAVTLFYGNYGF
jgi:hypothetical protein